MYLAQGASARLNRTVQVPGAQAAFTASYAHFKAATSPPGLSFLTWEREPDRVGEIEYQPVNEAQGM